MWGRGGRVEPFFLKQHLHLFLIMKTDFLRYLCIHTHIYTSGEKKNISWLFTQDTILTGIIPKVWNNLDSSFQCKRKRYFYQPIQILNRSYWRSMGQGISSHLKIFWRVQDSKIISFIGVVPSGFNCLATVIKKKDHTLVGWCCWFCFVVVFPT